MHVRDLDRSATPDLKDTVCNLSQHCLPVSGINCHLGSEPAVIARDYGGRRREHPGERDSMGETSANRNRMPEAAPSRETRRKSRWSLASTVYLSNKTKDNLTRRLCATMNCITTEALCNEADESENTGVYVYLARATKWLWLLCWCTSRMSAMPHHGTLATWSMAP